MFQVRSSGLLCAVALLFFWIAVLLAVAVGAVLAPPAGVITVRILMHGCWGRVCVHRRTMLYL